MDEITVGIEITIVSTVSMRSVYGLTPDLSLDNRNNSKHVTVAMVILLKNNVKHLRIYGSISGIRNWNRKAQKYLRGIGKKSA